MSTFNNYRDFAFTTIRENLIIAKYCLTTTKKEGETGCYGMPALLLLSSIIDIIGTFYRNGKYEDISIVEVSSNKCLGPTSHHFNEYRKKFVGNLCSKQDFLKYIYEYSRCKAVHNGLLYPNVFISCSKSKVIMRTVDNNTYVFLQALYDLVEKSFGIMIKESGHNEFSGPIMNDTGLTHSLS